MIKINATKTKFTSEVKNGGHINSLTIIDSSNNKVISEFSNIVELRNYMKDNDYEGNDEDLYVLINNDEKEV